MNKPGIGGSIVSPSKKKVAAKRTGSKKPTAQKSSTVEPVVRGGKKAVVKKTAVKTTAVKNTVASKKAVSKPAAAGSRKMQVKKQEDNLPDSISDGLAKHGHKKRGWRDIEALTERARLKSLLTDIWHEDVELDSDIFGETDHLAGYYTDKEEEIEVEDDDDDDEEWEEFEEDED